MHIGIITQPLGHNYGGTLQSFALQRILTLLGHNPVTFNYNSQTLREELYLRFNHAIRRIIQPRMCHKIPIQANVQTWERNFRRFEDRYIKTIKCKNRCRITDMDSLNNGIEALVVGSDQVWRPKYNAGKLLGNMYLDFAQNIHNIKRVAYAASFGKDIWEYNNSLTQKVAKLAHKFDAISVREESAVELCKYHLGVDATHVLDPTLLINPAEYLEIANKPNENNYIAVYMLDRLKQKEYFVNKISKEHNLTPIYIGTRDNSGVWQSIEDWLGYIANADMVITDSFHGTVFSILFQRDFITIGNSKRGLSRMTSLANKLSIDNRIIDETQIESYQLKKVQTDWDTVFRLLALLKEKSIKFLSNALV